MSKKVAVVSPESVKRAHRRRLPAVLKAINAELRNGHRTFYAGSSFPQGLFPNVLRAFRRQPGWILEVDDRYGKIQVSLTGEPTR